MDGEEMSDKHDPVASRFMDREQGRVRLFQDYVRHGDMARLERELAALHKDYEDLDEPEIVRPGETFDEWQLQRVSVFNSSIHLGGINE